MSYVHKHKKVGLAVVLFLACCSAVSAQDTSHSPGKALPATKPAPAAKSSEAVAHDKNIQAYIKLIRTKVQQEKSKLMGAVIQLDAQDSAKFWPIYRDYDAELTQVNNLRSDNILDYARHYLSLTDEKADELIKNAMDYQRKRADLLAKYYERVKQELGAITAARFVQIENQLLMLIDLQIASSLPIAGER